MIYKFNHGENYYIYDVSSNNILKVEKIIYDIIEEFQSLDLNSSINSGRNSTIPSLNRIINKFQTKYSIEMIKKAYNEILFYRKNHGIFTFKKPSAMAFPYSMTEIMKILNSKLEQLILNVTENCNMRCEYCVYSGKYKYERTHSKKKMSFSTASRAIEFFFKHNANSERIAVTFYGGEPLLNFSLIRKCVELSKKLAFKQGKDSRLTFSITTNGTLLDKNKINFLIKNNVGLLISLDGPKDIHDKYRKFINGKGSYTLIIESLKRIRELNPEYYKEKVGFSVVTLPEHLDSVVKFFGSYNLVTETDNLIINMVSTDDTSFFENYDFKTQLRKYRETIRKLRNMYKKYLVEGNYDSLSFKPLRSLFDKKMILIHKRLLSMVGEEIYPNGICLPGSRRLFVSTDGKFYICEKMGESIRIGDIYNGFDYKTIYETIQKYQEISEKNCLNCWLMRICNLCYVSARKGNVLERKKKDKYCEGMKTEFSKLMALYCEIIEKNPKILSYFDKYDDFNYD